MKLAERIGQQQVKKTENCSEGERSFQCLNDK